MKIKDIISETTAGGIAGVAMPIGVVQKRPSIFGSDPSIYTVKKRRKKKKKVKENLNVKTYTPEELAKKHNVPLEQIEKELKKGTKIEYEHSSDKATAREIALDHLLEMPDYYTELDRMEKGLCKDEDK